MCRSVCLVLLLAGCYDQPQIVVHVHRDSPAVDTDAQVCNADGMCDPKNIGTGAAVFGAGSKAIDRDLSVFDDHTGIVNVLFQDELDESVTLCVALDVQSMKLERTLIQHANPTTFQWIGAEAPYTPCLPQ